MIERKDIISEYEQTGSIRAVARNLGIHRQTVKNYVKEYLAAKAGGDETLTAYLKSEPSYKVPQRDRTVLTDEVRALINVCLRDNEEKRQEGRQEALHEGERHPHGSGPCRLQGQLFVRLQVHPHYAGAYGGDGRMLHPPALQAGTGL